LAKKQTVLTNMQELKKILATVPEDRKAIADSLYNELEFMQGTLVILRQQIKEEGPTAMFRQGVQEFLREHPALKAYNTTIQRYSLLYKQLVDLLPEPVKEAPTDPVIDFVRGDSQ